jgi:hypothetical protein
VIDFKRIKLHKIFRGEIIMFNERSGRWLGFYKVLSICMFFAIVLFGVIAGIGDVSGNYLDIGLGGDDDIILDFLSWFLLCGLFASIQLAVSMLIINFLRNVQAIREAIEKK